MPRFNDRGHVTPQIGYSWYDQSRFIFQDCSSGVCRVALSDGTTIAETGVVRLLGNGHRVWAYVEFTPGIDPTQAVYRDSFGQTLINTYPQAISPDGAICVKPHSNIGATVFEPDGRSWPLSDGDAQDIQGLSGGRWIWTIGGIVHSNFPIIGNPGVPVWWPRVADDGTLLYQHQGSGALILGGKVIGPPSPRYFSPDVRLKGDVYHVTWSPNQADTDAQFLTMTRAELAALPAVRDPRTPVPIPRTPTPTPDPEPEPVSDALDIIRVIRADYPTPLGARHWEFLVEVAQTLDVQLFRKEDSNSVLIPALGKRVSLDVIGRGSLGDRWADILQDSEGLAIPVWQIHDGAGGEYVDVSQVELPGAHPEPQPGRTLEQRVAAIEAWMARVRA